MLSIASANHDVVSRTARTIRELPTAGPATHGWCSRMTAKLFRGAVKIQISALNRREPLASGSSPMRGLYRLGMEPRRRPGQVGVSRAARPVAAAVKAVVVAQ